MKKVFLFISIITMGALISCNKDDNVPDAEVPEYNVINFYDGTRLFAEPTELSIMVPFFENWPVQDNWPVLDFIRDKTNVNLTVVPMIGDALPLMIVAGTQPDILQIAVQSALPLLAEGLTVNFMEFESEMPDFFEWLDNNRELAVPFFSPSGELFMIPQTDIGEANRQGWMFRQDIFERHGLEIPRDEMEFYDLLVRLRELYPGSTPFLLRNGVTYGTKICIMASQWNASFTYYLDRSTNTWKHGAIEDNFREYVVFMNKLFNANLIPVDFLSIDTRSWQERISASQGFITLDFLTRIDGFNIPMRETDSAFTLAFMPPFKGGPNGTATMQFTALNTSCFVVTGRINDAVKYINWLFTDEAMHLLSWGVEGETFELINGRRQFIGFADTTDLRARTGLSTLGMYGRFDYLSHVSLFSPELYHAYTLSPLTDQAPPGAVSFTEEEINILSTVGADIQSHKEEMIAGFIVNERPLSEWDDFVNEMYRLGLDKVLDIYNTAQARQR